MGYKGCAMPKRKEREYTQQDGAFTEAQLAFLKKYFPKVHSIVAGIELQRSKRARRKSVKLRENSAEAYLEAPSYSAQADKKAGGKHSTATLTPAGLTGMGTDAESDLPRGIEEARNTYPDAHFKAGHLLNADFGGAGDDYKNMTILTAKANVAHQTFDNAVKYALEQLGTAEDAFRIVLGDQDTASLGLGVSVSVEVTGKPWGKKAPEKYIFDELTCTALPAHDPAQVKKEIEDGIGALEKANDKLKHDIQTASGDERTVLETEQEDLIRKLNALDRGYKAYENAQKSIASVATFTFDNKLDKSDQGSSGTT